MSDIIGTIISVGDFLNNEDKEICIKKRERMDIMFLT